MKFKLLLSLILVSLLISPVCSSDIVENVEFMPDKFVFEYNDHNTTEYEGDIGLKVAYVNNTLDNHNYIVPKDTVRGIAYVTKKSFDFSEPVLISHGPLREWDGMYIIAELKFKNGTIIPKLSIEDDDLTKEQREYFDDYYEQRQDYIAQQQEYAAEDMYDAYQVHNSYNSRSKYSYYFGRGGSGVIYTPSY